MNKYTLQFNDAELEAKYQESQLNTVYLKVFYSFSGFSTFLMLLKVIDGALNDNQSQLEMKIAFLTYLVIQSLIVYKWRQYTRLALTLVNHFTMLFQIGQRVDAVQHTYLFGQNQMCVHTLIMMMSDFKEGAFTNVTLLIIRLTLAELKEDIEYQDYIFAIMVQGILMTSLYYKSLYQRDSYLLTLKDTQLDILMPNLISKPTLIFTFNKEFLKFEQKKLIQTDFLAHLDNPLQTFLRNAKYAQKNLEQYVFSRVKPREKLHINNYITRMEIQYLGKVQQITYIEYYLETQIFIIIVDSQDSHILKSIEKYENRRQIQNKFFLTFMKRSSTVMTKILRNKEIYLLFKLRSTYLEIMYRSQLKDANLQMVNLSCILDKFKNQINSMNISIEVKQTQIIIMKAIKPLLMLFLLNIFKNIKFHSTIPTIFDLDKMHNQVKIVVKGKLKYSNQQQNQFANFVRHYISADKSHIFILRQDPLISFSQQFNFI